MSRCVTSRVEVGLGRISYHGTRYVAPWAPRALALVAVLGASLSATGCTVARGGGPEPLDALSVGTLRGPPADGVVAARPAIFAAATRALARGDSEWLEARSGAWGTVRRTGPDDAGACTPAELTVHDYRGVRLVSQDLCPLTGAVEAP